jgi:hypothetical protein
MQKPSPFTPLRRGSSRIEAGFNSVLRSRAKDGKTERRKPTLCDQFQLSGRGRNRPRRSPCAAGSKTLYFQGFETIRVSGLESIKKYVDSGPQVRYILIPKSLVCAKKSGPAVSMKLTQESRE